MFSLYTSALHFRFLFHFYMSGSYFWFRFMIWMSGFWRLLSVSWGGTTMKTKKKFLADPFFRVVAILFVRFWGSRNSFRGTICAAKLWGNAGGPPAVSAFKSLYKNHLRYLKGILIREKKLIKKLSSPPSPFFEIQLFSLRVKKEFQKLTHFMVLPGGASSFFLDPDFW